jgi:hypothetical protein
LDRPSLQRRGRLQPLCRRNQGREGRTDHRAVHRAAEAHADALATLREAFAAGWKDFTHMQKDPDLTVLWDHPQYKELIAKLKAMNADEKK